jgi:hypothetical protein
VNLSKLSKIVAEKRKMMANQLQIASEGVGQARDSKLRLERNCKDKRERMFRRQYDFLSKTKKHWDLNILPSDRFFLLAKYRYIHEPNFGVEREIEKKRKEEEKEERWKKKVMPD